MRGVSHFSRLLHGLGGDRSGGKPGILTYRRIANHVPGLPPPLHNVRPERFREQLVGLRRQGFQFWPLSRLLDWREHNQSLPERVIVLTFDDGHQTLFTEGFPILQELQVPVALFVNTAYLDTPGPFPFDAWGLAYHDQAPPETYRALSTDQCRELQASGLVEIGAHTHTHADHRGHPDDFLADAEQSIQWVRDRLGVQRVSFAFPFGGRRTGFAGDDLVAAIRRSEATCALTTEVKLNDLRDDPFLWGRFNVFAWDTSGTLGAKLSGWYDWAPRLWHRLTASGRWKTTRLTC